MSRTQSVEPALVERLVRPQRLGVFGRRGVGKTTLLAMLYREAAAGRLPTLRLAAADARTADYLTDNVRQLEAGQVLPGTLSETELHFNLYQGERRVELVLLDYQGEHVAVGRQETVRDFFRECDAVWLLLDAAPADSAESALAAQQEVEQIVEDYLAAKSPETPHRPMALLITKADLLESADKFLGANADAAALAELADRRYGMARHALVMHCPWSGLFAVSALGGNAESATPHEFGELQPAGLAEPLHWLIDAVQSQDEARLESLRNNAANNERSFRSGLEAFARRYPYHPDTPTHRQHLREVRQRRLRRRGLLAGAIAATLLLFVVGYDAFGAHAIRRFAADTEDDPIAVRAAWQRFQTWHPTRHWLRPAAATAESEYLRDLDARVRSFQGDQRLREVRRLAADIDGDPETVWQAFRAFQADYPEFDLEGDLNRFQYELRTRREADRERRARIALADLDRAASHDDLPLLVESTDRFLKEFTGTSHESDVRQRRDSYLRRIDERDFETARSYSVQQPLNFHSRREKYRQYLERHPLGVSAQDATAAYEAIAVEWDKHDFRLARDQFHARPLDVNEVSARCRSYLAAHPDGRFRSAAADLLRWCGRSVVEGEYHVTLKSGNFSRTVAANFSRGPKLSVEIEVNGVKHGPSYIAERGLEPTWEFEFPRTIRWKLGDPVVIRVTDNWYYRRRVLEIDSKEADPMAMQLLSGAVSAGPHTLIFASDFQLPILPDVE